jgi:serine protease inhibitor
LFDTCQSDPEYVLIASSSIATALTMTYVGARGDTSARLADVLGIAAFGGLVHQGCNALDLKLSHCHAPSNPHVNGSPGDPLCC